MNDLGLTLIPPPYDMRRPDPRFRDDGTFYLLNYNGRLHCGTVEKQWYGWNFDAVYDAGLQMDSPGLDAVYEVTGFTATRDTPIMEILQQAITEERNVDD